MRYRLAKAMIATGIAASLGSTSMGQALPPEAKPFRGPLKPDLPLARGYNDSAKALAMVDDNPLIRWEYRVWCETGYRSVGDAGTGQAVDQLPDPKRDLVSPKGFFYSSAARTPMPAGGVRFLENAWYFGADGLGVIVVRSPEGLLVFDTMSTPDEFRQVVLSEMPAAGLDPKDIRYVFVGHYHWDHTGGVNLIRTLSPRAKVVISAPDAAIIDTARKELLAGQVPADRHAVVSPQAKPKTPEDAAALRATRIAAIPTRVDIVVQPQPGLKTGALAIRTGASTEVVAILDPGHTPGQMSVLVPVRDKGTIRKLLVMSGNDQPDQAAQYAISMDYLRSAAVQLGADTVINTHPYQSAMFYHLRQLKADSAAPNPFAMGPDGVSRFLGVFADCQRAMRQRLQDGTWQAF